MLTKFQAQAGVSKLKKTINAEELELLTGITAAEYDAAFRKNQLPVKSIHPRNSLTREWELPTAALVDIHELATQAAIKEIKDMIDNDASQALKVEQTIKLRRENALADGPLIPAGQVATSIAQAGISIKSAVESIADKLLKFLPPKNRRSMRVTLTESIDQVLHLLSNRLEEIGREFDISTSATRVSKPVSYTSPSPRDRTRPRMPSSA